MAAAPVQVEEAPNPFRWWILVGLILAAIMEVLDTTIINVSLPQMAGNLGATSEEIGWVSTGYILSNVVVLPMTAWLSSRFGRKNYLAGSIVLFIVASFFCGTSSSLGALIFWRILQGAGGAALLSTGQATLREIFLPSEQSIVQAIFILGIVVAPTLGPTVGGLITDNYSWHWNFLINIPLGLISLAFVWFFLQDSKFKMQVQSIDWLGIGLLTAGLGSLQYVLEEGNAKDWFSSPLICGLAAVAAFCLTIFGWWELHPTNTMPVVNLRVLKNQDLSAALVLFVVLGFGLYGGVFIYPMFAQNIMGMTPTGTGLSLLPGGLATAAAAVFCGRFLGSGKIKLDPRWVIATGLSIFGLSMYMLAGLPSNSGADNVVVALLLRGLGLGLLFIPINMVAFASLKGPEIAQGSGLLNLTRQLGGSLGIAILASFVTQKVATGRAALLENVYSGNPLFEQRLAATAQGFAARLPNSAAADKLALSLVDRAVNRQSLTIAYNTAFMMILIVVVVCFPAIFLLRKPKAAPAPADVH